MGWRALPCGVSSFSVMRFVARQRTGSAEGEPPGYRTASRQAYQPPERDGTSWRLSDERFADMLDRPVPPAKRARPFDENSTFGDIASTWLGRNIRQRAEKTMAETVSADESASGDPAFLPWNQMHVRKILNGSPLRGIVLRWQGRLQDTRGDDRVDERPLHQGALAHVAQITKRRALWHPSIAPRVRPYRKLSVRPGSADLSGRGGRRKHGDLAGHRRRAPRRAGRDGGDETTSASATTATSTTRRCAAARGGGCPIKGRAACRRRRPGDAACSLMSPWLWKVGGDTPLPGAKGFLTGSMA